MMDLQTTELSDRCKIDRQWCPTTVQDKLKDSETPSGLSKTYRQGRKVDIPHCQI